MPRVRTTRKFSSKIFLMTGIEDSKRVELGKKLKKLGGVYLKTDVIYFIFGVFTYFNYLKV